MLLINKSSCKKTFCTFKTCLPSFKFQRNYTLPLEIQKSPSFLKLFYIIYKSWNLWSLNLPILSIVQTFVETFPYPSKLSTPNAITFPACVARVSMKIPIPSIRDLSNRSLCLTSSRSDRIKLPDTAERSSASAANYPPFSLFLSCNPQRAPLPQHSVTRCILTNSEQRCLAEILPGHEALGWWSGGNDSPSRTAEGRCQAQTGLQKHHRARL